MGKTSKTVFEILFSAIKLFEENGYTETSMRQIAASSNVSLGLINHHFTSKAHLGKLTLNIVASMVCDATDRLINKLEEPVLYDAIITRATNLYFLNGRYRKFYIDCLREDIFWAFLSERSVETLTRITNLQGHPNLSEDELKLYGQYLPYSVEKTLVLNKEQGLFGGISYDEIPDYIIRTELERFVDAFTINVALDYSRKYMAHILEELPASIPEENIQRYMSRQC